jgi:hypothetical protein
LQQAAWELFEQFEIVGSESDAINLSEKGVESFTGDDLDEITKFSVQAADAFESNTLSAIYQGLTHRLQS